MVTLNLCQNVSKTTFMFEPPPTPLLLGVKSYGMCTQTLGVCNIQSMKETIETLSAGK